mmetsp:Transcript_10205/g.38677  ORF Transcript_10205/g.38677 Transcript_10205/m.38677 type:complete len:92 (+) Transcript_10205:154-429(+)
MATGARFDLETLEDAESRAAATPRRSEKALCAPSSVYVDNWHSSKISAALLRGPGLPRRTKAARPEATARNPRSFRLESPAPSPREAPGGF